MAIETCTFQTNMGVKIEAEAYYVPGFRASPTLTLRTEAGYIEELSFKSVREFRTYLKMLTRLDEAIGVHNE